MGTVGENDAEIRYRIQYYNPDEKDAWQEAEFAGTFDTSEAARKRLSELYSEWPSRFKRGRVVPVKVGGPPRRYELGCYICGGIGPLRTYPHRNDEGHICGFIYVCVDCAPLIEGEQYIIHMAPMQADDKEEA